MAHYYSSSSALPVLAPQPSHPFDSAADARPTSTTQALIHLVQGDATSRNQQNVPFPDENNIRLQLKLELPEDYWQNSKKLRWSDVDRGQCRLLLKKSFVEDHILRYRSDADQCRSADGLPIAVWDADEGRQFELRLKLDPGFRY